ncbi:Tryptophan/tyrosine permease family [Seminavis robusta]|uniref:Tryptophan/tyrosine permease family n=1 Tax=Seminavis robusta TaxID=568900 RepID=A0A9N8DI05_9STRA|nr:Tryptophan/tyrosine permease family [Seminavis robusta]|eukprot:Sro163_g073070.1 Tryptophan/tyrosine permease family (574) ;mRNA; r:14693-16414
MLDESPQMPLSLWLRSVGLENPFDEQSSNGSEHSGSRHSSSRGGNSRAGSRAGENGSTGGSDGGSTRRSRLGGGDEIDHYLNDVLVPPEDDEERKETVYTGSTVLALTLAGTCVVEAPYAFQKCGIFWGTLLFGILAFSTERAFHMLCICARKTGSNSYGTVARSSCGGFRAHWMTSALEIGVLLFLMVHFFSSFNRVIKLWLNSFQSLIVLPEQWGLPAFLVLMAPLLIPKKLHTLPYAWTIGLLNVAVFTLAVGVLAVFNFYRNGDQQAQAQNQESNDHEDGGRTVWDIVEGFQSLLITFFASFNVLRIQASLFDPTRERMATVVHQGVTWGASATYIVGIVGHLCALAHSPRQDADFLESIEYLPNTGDDSLLFVYRVCHTCGALAFMFTFPLVLTPCRYSILELFESCYTERQCLEVSDCQEDCETCTTRASTAATGNQHDAFVLIRNGTVVNSEATNLLPSIEENPTYDLLASPLALGLCTVGIMIWAYLGAVVVPFIDAFYTWVGPFMVYIFAFVLPALYFLGLKRPRQGISVEKKNFRLYARMLIFLCITGVVFAIVDIVKNLPTA